MTSAARSFLTAFGNGRTNTATASLSNRRCSAHPAIGTEVRLRWTRPAQRACAKHSASCTKRDLSIRAAASSIGVPSAVRRFPTPRSSMRPRRAASGICSTPSRRPAKCWSWPPPARRPCSATPALPFTPMTSAISTLSARTPSCRWSAESSPSLPTSMLSLASARALSK